MAISRSRYFEARAAFNRYYDPVTDQFLSVDPAVGITGTPYAFTGGDPVNGIDPMGLWSLNPLSDIAEAASDAGHFVAKHHQVIEQVATIAGAVVGSAACDAVTAGACSVFTPYIGAIVGTAVYAEGGGRHTAEGYVLAGALGGITGSLSMVWGGVFQAGLGLWAGDSAIGASEGIYDYSHSGGCHTLEGYVKAGITGGSENAPIKLKWLFGSGSE